MNINETLKQRQVTYGSFEDVAEDTQTMMGVVGTNDDESRTATQQIALFLICNKIARIINGDPDYIDNWRDIAGYAQLIVNELQDTNGASDSKVSRVLRVHGEWVEQ